MTNYVSIPVWFDWETQILPHNYCLFQCFNSSMVRLGGIIEHRIAAFVHRFNSSMVRLGVVLCGINDWHCFAFQFQYGSIGSVAGKVIIQDPIDVSIPVWFDWEF